MLKDAKQEEPLSPLIQEVIKNLISAIRVVKIYPPNNPIYSQSIKKSHQTLAHFLETSPDFHLGVQKNYFTCGQTPFGKDSQVNKAIIQDLFAKGIRDIFLASGVTEAELFELYQALALSAEELAMKSGISTVLWERGATHIKVTEAGLEDIVADERREQGRDSEKNKPEPLTGRTLVLSDAKADPEGFAASMVAFAKKTRAAYESIEDRLFTLYQQASRKINQDHEQDSQNLFEGLAKSMLALEPLYRQALIGGRLYGGLDDEAAAGQDAEDQAIPNDIQEIRTGRFSNDWTVQQVATLLKKIGSERTAPAALPPDPALFPVTPLGSDLDRLAQSVCEESTDYLQDVKMISDAGMESDIIDAAVRTLTSLIPLAANPARKGSGENEQALFPGIVLQLEDLLSYLLKKNNYKAATSIVRAFQNPADSRFKPLMAAALKKRVTPAAIRDIIGDMRKHTRNSPKYDEAYAYLASLNPEAIETLLGLLTEERDRSVRMFLLDILKDFGRNQTALFGDHLLDERWYVVRNIVSILGESRTDEALAMLRKAAEHKNVKIRQEVIRALVSIGGKKAAGLLARFLQDRDADIQLTAAHALADCPGAGVDEAVRLQHFLEGRSLKKKELERSLAGIKALGSTGGNETVRFLQRYERIRWWRPRKIQEELRTAAQRSIQEITRRGEHGGQAKR